MRISAIGDLHVGVDDVGRYRETFAAMAGESELLLLAGDLTDLGLEREARRIAADLSGLPVPVVAVLGNHDYYSGEVPRITAILRDAGVTVLEGDLYTQDDLGIVGLKGTAGGFNRMLAPIAEPEIVAFAQLSVPAAAALDAGLTSLSTPKRLVLLHYAPIVGTIVGEILEEYPFMGSSRFAEVIDRHRPDRVLHGHSHFGTFAGATPGGIPVNNVAMQVSKPDPRPYALFEI